jgi:hypothetical protein
MISTVEAMRERLREAEARAAVDNWGICVPVRALLADSLDRYWHLYSPLVEILRETESLPRSKDTQRVRAIAQELVSSRSAEAVDRLVPGHDESPDMSAPVDEQRLKPHVDRAKALVTRFG